MKNAKEELIKKIGTTNIVWAKIDYPLHDVVLAPNHTTEEKKAFFDKLDFNYDNGYGMQFIYGTVMLSDNSWLERREYDGGEWWERCYTPQW